MKKTIIASAIAAVVAAPAAFADISVSGQINQEFSDNNSAGGLQADLNSDLVFQASEDLGNGLKASAKIHLYFDEGNYGDAGNSASDESTTTADQTISLSGDFGSLTVGRMEPFIEGKIASQMNIDHADSLDLEWNAGNTGRSNNMIAYVSPNFNGLTVGVAGGAVEAAANTDDMDVTSVYVSYSNSGLTVQAATETVSKGTSVDEESAAFSASYKMGDLEVRAARMSIENDGNSAAAKTEATFYGAKYTLGANEFSVGALNADTTSTASSGNDGDMIYSVKHSLSKNTNVYLTQYSDDNADNTTLVGMQMKF